MTTACPRVLESLLAAASSTAAAAASESKGDVKLEAKEEAPAAAAVVHEHRASDDLQSFVRSCYLLKNGGLAEQVRGFRERREWTSLKDFWQTVFAERPPWRECDALAESGDYDALKKALAVLL